MTEKKAAKKKRERASVRNELRARLIRGGMNEAIADETLKLWDAGGKRRKSGEAILGPDRSIVLEASDVQHIWPNAAPGDRILVTIVKHKKAAPTVKLDWNQGFEPPQES